MPQRSGPELSAARQAVAERSTPRSQVWPWLPWVTTALCVAGLGVASYLTLVHFDTSVSLVCPATGGIVNCEKVTTSPESVIFGIPVAVLGLAFFAGMLPLNLPAAWRSELPLFAWARLAGVVVGVCFVAYLVYAELHLIGSICLWCTSVHAITVLLFVLTLAGSTRLEAISGQRSAAD
jgi:uncharacterized membrane protein